MAPDLSLGFHSFNAFADARAQRMLKTLSYSGTGGALVLEALDREVERLVNYKNVVRMNVPRVSGESDKYKVVQRTAGTTAGEFVAETGDFTNDEGDYDKASFQFRTLGHRGKVTRFAQATGRSFINVLAEEIDGSAEDFKDFEELKNFYATANTTNEYNGLHYLMDSGQVVAATSGTTGVALTLQMLDELWDQTKVFPDLSFISFKTRRAVNALLQSYQRFINTVEVNGGFMVTTYNHTPLLPSSNIGNVMTWDGSAVSDLTGGNTSAIYNVTTDKFFIAELTPLTLMMLARASSQYEEFDMFEDQVPVLKNKYHAAMLGGFSP